MQELAETKRILKGLAGQVLRGGVDRADAAVANQILSTYVRATSVELQAREQLELVGRLEEVEEALDLRGKVRGA